jgi:hypothetical protein
LSDPLKYREFNLRISEYKKEGSTFRVCVEGETPGGAMPRDKAVERRYIPNDFWAHPDEGKGGLLGQLEERRIDKDNLCKLGQMLADLALPEGEIRGLFQKNVTKLKAGEALRLRLRIDPNELVCLPWEYMHIPQASHEDVYTDFLALRREISIVRTDTVEGPMPQFNPGPIKRIVGVLSSPEDLQPHLNIDKDREAIENAVRLLQEHSDETVLKKITWVKHPATADAMQTALKDNADIFHFAGHARFDPITGDGQIILEKNDHTRDVYNGKNLMQILSDAKTRLVVLNACETGHRDGQKMWNGIAPSLTRMQIPVVIANQFKITDEHARIMASSFYRDLLLGYTVDESLYQARKAIYQDAREVEQRDWGVPVLYLRGLVDAAYFPMQIGIAEKDFYSQMLRFHQEMEKIYKRITNDCEPLVEGKLIGANQSEAVFKSVKQLSRIIDDVYKLLTTEGKIALGNSPLLRYKLIAALDSLKEWREKLASHIGDFPIDGQTRSTPLIRRWVRRDLENLHLSMQEMLQVCQAISSIHSLQTTSIQDYLNGTKDN